jgi:hypothetical protein
MSKCPFKRLAEGTGCVFARVAGNLAEKGEIEIGTYYYDRDGFVGFESFILECFEDAQDKELGQIIFPEVSTKSQLEDLFEAIQKMQIYTENSMTTNALIEGGCDSGEAIAFTLGFKGYEILPMILGPFEFFSPNRRCDQTNLVFRTNPTLNKQTKNPWRIGVDQMGLNLGVDSSKKFQSVLAATRLKVSELCSNWNRKLFRARNPLVLPTSRSQNSQNQ